MLDGIGKFGMTVEQAENTTLNEYSWLYQAYAFKKLEQQENEVFIAMVDRVAGASRKDGKYEYKTPDDMFKALGLKQQRDNLEARMFPVESGYAEREREKARRKAMQERFNAML